MTSVHYLIRSFTSTNRDVDKAETFNACFTSVFSTDDGLQECGLGDDKLPADSALVWDLLLQLDAHKSIGLDGIHSRYWMSWPILLWGPFPLFFKGLGSLERSQSIGSWLMSQFSKRVKRKTLVITGLSVSLWCLVKLWRRLFWESLKITFEWQCSH